MTNPFHLRLHRMSTPNTPNPHNLPNNDFVEEELEDDDPNIAANDDVGSRGESSRGAGDNDSDSDSDSDSDARLPPRHKHKKARITSCTEDEGENNNPNVHGSGVEKPVTKKTRLPLSPSSQSPAEDKSEESQSLAEDESEVCARHHSCRCITWQMI